MADDPRGTEGAKSAFGGAGRHAGMGLQFALSIILFLYLGQWLDGRFGTKPLFLYLGVFTGAGAAFYSIYRSLMADQRREEAEMKQKKAKREAQARTDSKSAGPG